MCGISGIYNCFGREIDSQKIIKKIVQLQHRRGPDGNGIWESKCKKVIFGHNRLSIIDLSTKANQPLVSRDKNYVITFNGEIYNFKEIKLELENKKIKFNTNSDTEVIIEAYKYWGLNFLKKLRGMFAFAIWDNIKRKIILARDPLGIKPLYYTKKNGMFFFASQIKSILSVDNINKEISNSSIVSYYLWGNIQEPNTLYKNIKSIEKGTCLVLDNNGKEELIIYADIKKLIIESEQLKISNENEKLIYLKEIIEETSNYHHVSDVPTTLLLSSGVDSNLLLASMNQGNKTSCSALTLDFKFRDHRDEVKIAKESSELNHIKHLIRDISNEEFFSLVEKFYEDMDSPTNDGFNNYLISYQAKKINSKIIISGIGGDELFLSYPSFKLVPKILNICKFLPKSDFINYFIKKNIYPLFIKNNLKTKYLSIPEYGNDFGSAFFLIRSLFLPFEINEIISPELLKSGLEELNFHENFKKDIAEIEDERLSIMYLEIKYYLTSKLLKDSDWASMSHSIELRTPFVDWFFIKKLIPLIKLDKNFNKLKTVKCMDKKLPQGLQKRKKTGFNIPHDNFLKLLSYKKKYSNPIRDWSIISYEKYLKNEK